MRLVELQMNCPRIWGPCFQVDMQTSCRLWKHYSHVPHDSVSLGWQDELYGFDLRPYC